MHGPDSKGEKDPEIVNTERLGRDSEPRSDIVVRQSAAVSRLVSDKCDWQVVVQPRVNLDAPSPNPTVQRSDFRLQGTLSGEGDSDWRLKSSAITAAGTRLSAADDLVVRLPASSSMRVSADKCDWRVSNLAFNAAGSTPELLSSLHGHTQAGESIAAASSKCDFNVKVVGDNRRTAVSAAGGALAASLTTGGAYGDVSASKCDWQVSVGTSSRVRSGAPHLRASLTSDKCDYTLSVYIGINGGAAVRLQAAGSAKCDFRLGEIYVDEAKSQSPKHE